VAGDPGAGRDPRAAGEEVFAAIGPVPRASAATPTPKIKGSNVPLPQYLDSLGNDVAQFWQGHFNRTGYRFPPARQVVVTRNATSECNGRLRVTAQTNNAFYCPADQTVFLPATYMENRFAILGDAAAALVVAHEWAHRVQHVTGVLQLRAQGRLYTKQTELQADCLAGLWAASEFRRGRLDPGDLDEFYNAVASVGDPPGTSAADPRAHGSAEEREAAFKTGYTRANARACTVRPS
jgi:predicted metalloprotease